MITMDVFCIYITRIEQTTTYIHTCSPTEMRVHPLVAFHLSLVLYSDENELIILPSYPSLLHTMLTTTQSTQMTYPTQPIDGVFELVQCMSDFYEIDQGSVRSMLTRFFLISQARPSILNGCVVPKTLDPLCTPNPFSASRAEVCGIIALFAVVANHDTSIELIVPGVTTTGDIRRPMYALLEALMLHCDVTSVSDATLAWDIVDPTTEGEVHEGVFYADVEVVSHVVAMVNSHQNFLTSICYVCNLASPDDARGLWECVSPTFDEDENVYASIVALRSLESERVRTTTTHRDAFEANIAAVMGRMENVVRPITSHLRSGIFDYYH